MEPQHFSVIVVGAGIVGASVANQLARIGHQVLLLDQQSAAKGVTSGAFGWLNSSNGPTSGARSARAKALEVWHQPPYWDHVKWCGALRDSAVDGARPYTDTDSLNPVSLNISDPVWQSDEDGMVDPVRVVAALLTHQNIALRTDVTVSAVHADRVQTDQGQLTADFVVVAAGLGSLALLPDFALWPGPATLAEFGFCPPVLGQIIQGWGVELRQRVDGTLVGVFAGAISADEIQAATERVLGVAVPTPVLRQWDRPMTKDAVPICGQQANGVYAAVGHPGVIMAPWIGQMIAAQIGPPVDL